MKSRHVLRAAAIAAALSLEVGLSATGARAAQTKAFLDLNGSPPPTHGEKTSAKAGWIEISSFSWGVGRGVEQSPTGSAAGRGATNELTITLSNPGDVQFLMTQAVTGHHFPSVELIDYKVTAKGALVPIYSVKLTDVVVKSFAASSGGDRPSDSLALAYESVEIMSNAMGSKTEDPTVPTGWNIVTNKIDSTTTPP